MKEKLPKGAKERLVSYLPVELVRQIHMRAVELNKTQSKYISDLVKADLEYSKLGITSQGLAERIKLYGLE